MAKKPTPKLVPTVTIGGAPASYKPQTLQPTVTIGGAPAGYKPTPTSVIPSSTTTRATPGQFRKAEEASNLTGPIQYAPTIESINKPSDIVTPLDEKGNFNENLKEDETKLDSELIDAFALLEAQLRQWGLESLAKVFISLATQGYKPQEAMNKIKYDTSINPATGRPWNYEYTKRFAGNAARIKKGLNAYTEAEYLALEDSYADTLRRNNLTTLISTNAESNQAQFAGYMEQGLSATEFADRIDEVSQRVIYGSKETKDQFKEYFPALTDTDIISYILRPDITMPIIKTKIAAAEIGGISKQVGLGATSLGMAETLAQAGISKDEARAGYGEIAEFLPDAELYSKIYSQEGITYNKETAEQDVFLRQQSSTAKRKRLASLERAAFEGSSGRLRTSKASENQGAF